MRCLRYCVIRIWIPRYLNGLERDPAFQTNQSTNKHNGRHKRIRGELLQSSKVRATLPETASIKSSGSRSFQAPDSHSFVHPPFSIPEFLELLLRKLRKKLDCINTPNQSTTTNQFVNQLRTGQPNKQCHKHLGHRKRYGLLSYTGQRLNGYYNPATFGIQPTNSPGSEHPPSLQRRTRGSPRTG